MLSFSFGPSANMEGEAFMSHTAASHQGAIDTFWLHFCGALLSSIILLDRLGQTVYLHYMMHFGATRLFPIG